MKRLAHVVDGKVVQVSSGSDDDQQHRDWLAAVSKECDFIIDVTHHKEQFGYGVNAGDDYNEADGFRPFKAFPSWVWSGTAWVAPIPEPETGRNWWDETSQRWVTAE